LNSFIEPRRSQTPLAEKLIVVAEPKLDRVAKTAAFGS